MREFDDIDDIDDGNNDKYEAEREEALTKFENQLLSGNKDFEYEPYEWSLLADYAEDVNNDFLYDEAITRGLIAFPDDPELNDRKLLRFLNNANPESARRAVQMAMQADKPSKIVRLNDYFLRWDDLEKKPSPDKAYRDITKILFDGQKIKDLEILEALSILSRTESIKNIASEIQKWEKTVYNVELLWYEIVEYSLENFDHDFAVKTVEKLVTHYPYNTAYWILKAKVLMAGVFATDHRNVDKIMPLLDEVLSILDTILAINPDHAQAQALKQRTIDFRESFKIMPDGSSLEADERKLLDRKPEDPMTIYDLIKLLDMEHDSADDRLWDWIQYNVVTVAEDDFVLPEDYHERQDFYGLIKALYVCGRRRDVDELLERIYILCDYIHPPLLPLKIIRLIERRMYDEAADEIDDLDELRPGFEVPDPTKFALRVILNKTIGNDEEATTALNSFEEGVVEALLVDEENPYHAKLDPCVLCHLTGIYNNLH